MTISHGDPNALAGYRHQLRSNCQAAQHHLKSLRHELESLLHNEWKDGNGRQFGEMVRIWIDGIISQIEAIDESCYNELKQ